MYLLNLQTRRFATTIDSVSESLRSKGYLRSHKPYSPPEDAERRLNVVFEEHLGTGSTLSNGRVKFKVLADCFKEFNHSVPNSLLHAIQTKGKRKQWQLIIHGLYICFELRWCQGILPENGGHTDPARQVEVNGTAAEPSCAAKLPPLPSGHRHKIWWN